MAAWDQMPLEAPGAIFSRQPDYADTMAKILSSPGATLRNARTDTRDYGLEMEKAAALKKYQEGSLALDAEKNRLTAEGQGPAGPWGGTGQDAQDSNILWAGNQPGGDTNSTAYQQAFARQYRTKKPHSIQQPDGTIKYTYDYDLQPPGIKTPGSGGSPPPPVPGPTVPPPPAGAGGEPAPAGAPGDPAAATPDPWAVDPGETGKTKPTEAENRARARLTIGTNGYNGAATNWDALTEGPGEWGSLANKAGQSIGGLGETLIGAGTNVVMSDKYQQAATGVASLAQTYLYAMSGANAPIEEANKIIAAVMPAVGDKPGQLAAKRRTLDAMKKALEDQAALPASPPPIDAAIASQKMIDIATGAGGGPAPAGSAPAPAGGAGGAPPPPPPGFTIDPQ